MKNINGKYSIVHISKRAFVIKTTDKVTKALLKEQEAIWNPKNNGWMFPIGRKTQIFEILTGAGRVLESESEVGFVNWKM